MKSTFFLYYLSFLTVLGSTCDKVYDMGYGTCKFYVSYPSAGDCNKFTLDYCAWSKCSGGSCYGKNPHSWPDCTYACCDASVVYPMNQQGLEACRQYVQHKEKINIVLTVVITTIVVSFFIGFCCCCCCCCCCRDRCQHIRNTCCCCQGCCQETRSCQQLGNQVGYCLGRILQCICCCCFRGRRAQVRNYEQPSMQQLQQYFEGKKSQWQSCKQRNPHLEDVCSICLQQKFRPHLQLRCGHVYHPACIMAWLQKKQECVMCRSAQVDRVRVYCSECEMAFIRAQLTIDKDRLNNNMVCDECRQKGGRDRAYLA